MCFLQNPEFFFFFFFLLFFFHIFNLDVILLKCIGGRYIVSATLPTVFGRSF